MLSRTGIIVATLLFSGLGCSTEVVTKYTDGPTTDTSPTDPKPTSKTPLSPIAKTVTVDKISLYQAVQVRLVDEGKTIETPNAPILRNRPALVRVHAAKDASITTAKVTAKLHVTVDGEEKVITDGPKALAAYEDASLDSTFNFKLAAEEMTADLKMSVELVGASDDDKVTSEELTIDAQTASKLRVELVPVKYAADGSDRMPVLDDKNVQRYRDALYRMYPISEIEMTQHAPLDWEVPVEPTGSGWDSLLNAIMQMRVDETIDEDVYYVGVFNPAATLAQYCGKGGCVLGVAPATGLGMDIDHRMELRSALVVGYQTSRSGGTIAQELAHAMGRLHAPCGNPAAIDKDYPYKNARVGSTGWDPISGELVSGDDHADFMSYCNPVWVSDYTYKSIFDRMSKVTAAIAGTQKSFAPATSSAPSAASRRATHLALSKEQIAWTTLQK
jgi:hypothetical protein